MARRRLPKNDPRARAPGLSGFPASKPPATQILIQPDDVDIAAREDSALMAQNVNMQ